MVSRECLAKVPLRLPVVCYLLDVRGKRDLLFIIKFLFIRITIRCFNFTEH